MMEPVTSEQMNVVSSTAAVARWAWYDTTAKTRETPGQRLGLISHLLRLCCADVYTHEVGGLARDPLRVLR